MKKLRVWVLKKELGILESKEYSSFEYEYVKEFQNSYMIWDEKNSNWVFKSKYYNKLEKIEVEFWNIDFENRNFFDHLVNNFKGILERTFEDINYKFPKNSIDDYCYINSDDNHFKRILNRISYEYTEWNDIFDFFTDIFITVLEGHKLRNGNKRFAFCFLIKMLWNFDYYFKWSETQNLDNSNFYVKKERYEQEANLFCFVCRLSTRTYEDLLELVDQINTDKFDKITSEIEKKCVEIIKLKDKGLSYNERRQKLKDEMKVWIKENTLFAKFW